MTQRAVFKQKGVATNCRDQLDRFGGYRLYRVQAA
jgi:hypothetical protein